ncbi:MAG: hypothetical protein QM813_10910 [Verrucomicrobiota bacterium]
MKHKISVTKIKRRGVSTWQVRWTEAGRAHRKFFDTKLGAEAHAAIVSGEILSHRKRIMAMSQSDVEKLLLVHSESQRRGIDLASLLTLLQSAKDAPASHSIKSVITEMEETKRKAGRDSDYLDSLENICLAFCKGVESRDVSKFTVKDVERFLDGKKIESRSTLRSRLSTMFKFAVRRGYRADIRHFET